MTQQDLSFGTGAENDGEFVATAFAKIQANFDELYAFTDAPFLTGTITLTKASGYLFKHDSVDVTGNFNLAFSTGGAPSGGSGISRSWYLGYNVTSTGTREDASTPALFLAFKENFTHLVGEPHFGWYLGVIDEDGNEAGVFTIEAPQDGAGNPHGAFRLNTWAFESYADRVSHLAYDWDANRIHVYESVRQSFEVNNVPIIQQKNAAASDYLSLPWFDDDDVMRMQGPMWLLGPRAGAGATYPGEFAVLQVSTASDGDSILSQIGPNSTGSLYSLKAQAGPTGEFIHALWNNRAELTAHAAIHIRTIGATGGDPNIRFDVNGAGVFSVGIDNSDSDKFQICRGSAMGTTPAISIDGSGGVTLHDNIGFYGTTPIAKPSNTLTTLATIAPVSGIGYGFSHATMATILAGYNEMVRTLQVLGLHT